MFHLVVDLEMCNVPKIYRRNSYNYSKEIIQIGAVLLDDEFKRVATLTQYVHPEYGVIDHFIENLTGIKNSQVKNAPLLQDALIAMLNWIGDREYQVYAWSETDRNQILHELKAKKIDDERIVAFTECEKWIDYQSVFMERFGIGRQISLEEALNRTEIEPEGRFHDGLVDAINTGYLIEKLELNPGYQLVSYEVEEKETRPLSSTLGELFSNLNFQFT